MSEEVAIIAVAQVAPGKVERFKEVLVEAMKWIEANEPETLEFAFYEEVGDDGTKISMYERYANRAAMERHQSSDNLKKVFQIMTEEQLLAEAPAITVGNFFNGYRR